jgi:hypothetical protein
MITTRFLALFLLAAVAQGASATTIWLKDNAGQVCKNSLSTNPGQVIGLGTVTSAGALTLTISNPSNGTKMPSSGECLNLPTAPAANPLVITGSVTPQMLSIHMWKEWNAQTSSGTMLRKECLDQGSNFSGIIGLVTSNPYRFNFTGGYTDGCNMQTQTKITSDGLPVFVRGLVIRQQGRELPLFTGSYYIFNEANRIPEPGSLALLLAGAGSLILLATMRRRTARQARG